MEHKSKQTKRLAKAMVLAALFTLLVLVVRLTPVSYAAETIDIPVKVTFDGSSLPTEVFRVEISGGSLSEKMVKDFELSNGKKSAEGSFAVENPGVGIYCFGIREIRGSTDKVTYCDKEYLYYVEVDSDGSIKTRVMLKGQEGKPDKEKPGAVVFDNSYHSGSKDEVEGDPPVRIEKIITGDKPPDKKLFKFLMKPAGNTAGLEQNPLPEGYGDGPVEVTVRAGEEVEIGYITFHKEGVYKYKVVEKDTKIEGYDYDDAVFDVSYTISRDQDGNLVCEREIIKNKTERVKGCTFNNIYDSSGGSAVNKAKNRIVRAVQTGDPGIMVPLTMLVIALIALIALLMTKDRRRERKNG